MGAVATEGHLRVGLVSMFYYSVFILDFTDKYYHVEAMFRSIYLSLLGP